MNNTDSERDELFNTYHLHSCRTQQMPFKGQKEPFKCDCRLVELIERHTERACFKELSDLKNHVTNPSQRDDLYYFDIGYRAMERIDKLTRNTEEK